MVTIYGKLTNGEDIYPIYNFDNGTFEYKDRSSLIGHNSVMCGFNIDLVKEEHEETEEVKEEELLGNMGGYFINYYSSSIETPSEAMEDFLDCFNDTLEVYHIDYKLVKKVLNKLDGSVFVINRNTYNRKENKEVDEIIYHCIIPDIAENATGVRPDHIILHNEIIY